MVYNGYARASSIAGEKMDSIGGQKSPQEGKSTGKNGNAQSSMSMNELSDLDLGLKGLKYGDIVAGTVVRVDAREILIDIGAKSEGIVDSKEMEGMSADAVKKFHVGDRILAFVLRSEDRNGNVVLSLARAQLERDWRDAEELLKSEQIFESQVAGFNKGGLIVRVGKVRGFVPATQLESTFRKKGEPTESENKDQLDLSAFVGKKLHLKIIELDRERNRLILSERAAMREVRKGQKEKLLLDLKEGDVVSGTVTSVADFGVFVALGGVDGMIHLSEMSWTKINHPNDLVKVGDQVQVKVLSIERERERIALSLKRLQPEPWTTVEERYKIGQLVNGTITKLASFGAFARLDDNIEGLIHISELADRRIQHPKEVVKEGDAVTLRVIRIDAQRRRLGLSLKRASEEYADDLPVETPEEDWQEAEGQEPSDDSV
jgi:small subunit ribosomal protein S1